MSEEIIKQWLTGATNSVDPKDLESHMGMISKRVNLQGVPGFDNEDETICGGFFPSSTLA